MTGALLHDIYCRIKWIIVIGPVILKCASNMLLLTLFLPKRERTTIVETLIWNADVSQGVKTSGHARFLCLKLLWFFILKKKNQDSLTRADVQHRQTTSESGRQHRECGVNRLKIRKRKENDG